MSADDAGGDRWLRCVGCGWAFSIETTADDERCTQCDGQLEVVSQRWPLGDPLEPLGAIANALDGAVDGVRVALVRLPPDSPAYLYGAELIGALNVAQTHLQARVLPAVQALEPERKPPGDPGLN